MSALKIESYRFGEIVIQGNTYRRDLILFPNRVLPDWWRRAGHSLCLDDLQAVLDDPPAVLVIGQGASARMEVPDAVRGALKAHGLRVITQPTAQACQTYNELCEHEHVAAALHLTC